MKIVRRLAVVAGALFVCAVPMLAASAAPVPSVIFDTRQYPGAPVRLVQARGFANSSTRLICPAFVVGSRPLTAVTFSVASLTPSGTPVQQFTLTRHGTWPSGISVLADPNTDLKSCVGIEYVREDGPVLAVRLTAATYDDGTTWAAPDTPLSPDPRAVLATPSPKTAAIPITAKRSGALAVAYGTKPAQIAVFAPGSTTPATQIALTSCCIAALAFDAAGNLYVETPHNGLSVFAPGATTPSRHLDISGDALAVDAAGNIAAGGPELFIARGAAAPVQLDNVRVASGGVAFAANGELKVANIQTASIETYAPGATTVSASAATTKSTTRFSFGSNGAYAFIDDETLALTVIPANAKGAEKTVTQGFQPSAFAVTSGGQVLLGTGNTLFTLPAFGVAPTGLQPKYGAAVDAIAIGPDGTFATADRARGIVLLYNGADRVVIDGLAPISAIAISP